MTIIVVTINMTMIMNHSTITLTSMSGCGIHSAYIAVTPVIEVNALSE